MQDINIIKDLANIFDLNNIEHYKTLVALVKQYLIAPESIEKYELFLLIESIIKGLEKMEMQERYNINNLYLYFIPERLRD